MTIKYGDSFIKLYVISDAHPSYVCLRQMLGVDIFFRTKSPLLWPKSLLNYLILAVFQYLPFLFSAFKVNELVCVCFRFSRVNTNSDHSAKLSCSTTAVPTHYSKEMMIQESYDGPIEKSQW